MSYRHPTLKAALEWKYRVSFVEVQDGVLIHWPGACGDAPNDTEQEQAVEEYEMFTMFSGQAVLALAKLGVIKGLWTKAELRQAYRSI